MLKIVSLNLLLLISCSHLRDSPAGSLITVRGRIYITGNEPFTEVALESQDGKVYILKGWGVNELRGLQGRIVEVEGRLMKRRVEEKGAQEVIKVEKFTLREESRNGL